MGKSKQLFTELRAKEQAENPRKYDPNYQPNYKGYQFESKNGKQNEES